MNTSEALLLNKVLLQNLRKFLDGQPLPVLISSLSAVDVLFIKQNIKQTQSIFNPTFNKFFQILHKPFK